MLAGGLDRIYPPEHAEPARRDRRPTAPLITEMPLGWEPRARDFPRRNRLISGLALGVVVVEAATRSGSLITARLALEQGREVFAVPGSPLDPRAAGSNSLLKQGATLVTEAADVIDVLRPILGQPLELGAEEPDARRRRRRASPEPTSARASWSLLGPTPVDDRRAGPAVRQPRRRSCGRSCSSSISPAGWSATAAGWCRCLTPIDGLEPGLRRRERAGFRAARARRDPPGG